MAMVKSKTTSGWVELACPDNETTILYGDDAKRFIKLMNAVRPVSRDELDRMEKNYKFVKSIATFDMP